jgi:hypothetical protein
MIKFRINNNYPRNKICDNLHTLVAKKTIYGIHLPYNNLNTKTHIISFINHNDANIFKNDIFLYQQIYRNLPERILDNNTYNNYNYYKILLNMNIISMKKNDLELICNEQWFNMLIVYNISEYINCYLFTSQYPKINTQINYFNNMYKYK